MLPDGDEGVLQPAPKRNLEDFEPVAENHAVESLCHDAFLKFTEFRRNGRIEDLNDAISKEEQAIEATPENHPNLTGMLNNLSVMFSGRHERMGRLWDLDEAIRVLDRAVEITPEGHPNRAIFICNLGDMLLTRFTRTGKMENLEEAINKTEQAIGMTPNGHQNLPRLLRSLGNQLQRRFERTGRLEDLTDAIDRLEQAVEATPKGHPDWAGCLKDLSVKLIRRYERMGKVDDLEEAIIKAGQAVEATPKYHEDLARRLHNLANMLEDLFDLTGRIEDLQEAVRIAEQAVDATPKDHPDLAQLLDNLGTKLINRFRLTGRIEDLEESIRIGEQAVKATPKDHPYLAGCLNNLANKLMRRFEKTERMEDLREAIRRVEQAAAVTPKGSPGLPVRLNSLGVMLEMQFERTGRIEDLEEAIRIQEQAIKALPVGHPSLSMYLSNLSVKLARRFERTGKTEDLDEAILEAEKAVEIAPEGHQGNASSFHNLSNHLKTRYTRIGRTEDLKEAIRRAEQAVEATPEDHVELGGRLKALGDLLCLSSESPHQIQALKSFLKSCNCVNGTPSHRVAAARQAIRLLKQQSDWSEASAVAKQAISLLPVMTNRSLDLEDQQHVVSRFSGLIADACSLSLQAGDDVAQALELLERGRGVIMGLLIDDRSEISQLEASYPKIAATYDRLRNVVNAPAREIEDLKVRQGRKEKQYNAVRELNDCIRSIRKLPGHERFLLGPTSEELMNLAAEGSIVVVNVTDIRSDAFIISRSAIKSIRLPELTAAEAVKWIQLDLIRYMELDTPVDRGKKNKRYLEFLLWLWSKCVNLILQEMHNGQKPTFADLPRIWWIGVGIASSFPFHAAGDHSPMSTENTMSRAISSYTPTIKALAYARERAAAMASLEADKPRLLIVTMPTTPGGKPLPGVTEEMVKVQLAVKSAFEDESLVQPNAKIVLDKLRQCDLVHFACHGLSDHLDPFNSYLMLQDSRAASPKLDKLTVRQVSEANLRRARIAYLSACSTAENRAEQLVDEVIHLASGFQVAGYSHVIASTWSSDDSVCVKVAKGFYERLKTDWFVQKSNKAIAAALHNAIEEVRLTSRKKPLQWAPYIHLGA